MKKVTILGMCTVLALANCLLVPNAEACDAAMCEMVTECYGCYWYGVLFTNCFTGGCNTCATMRCEDNLTSSEGEVASVENEDLGRNQCSPEEVPRSNVDVLQVQVLPDRT